MKLILAATLALATVVPSMGMSASTETCVTATEGIIRPMAKARDSGLSAEGALLISITAGLDPSVALQAVRFVYKNPLETPQELSAKFLTICMENVK